MTSNGQNGTKCRPQVTITLESQSETTTEERKEIRAGDLCPQCQQAEIDYDGMLNLVCLQCGYTLAGCFT